MRMGDAMTLPTVRLIATGGTIASRPEARGGPVRPQISGPELLASVPALAEVARLEVEELAAVPSWDITPALMLELAQRAETALARPEVAGVVVTHGTDTVEETSLLVDLVVRSDKPVCFAVAMRNAAEVGADGPRNLLDAVRVAASPAARGRGAMLVVNGEIHAARFVTKTDKTNLSTFRSPNHGRIGVLGSEGPIFLAPPLPRQPLAVDRLEERVALVKVATGMDATPIRRAVAEGAAGIVVEGSGAGNVPSAVAPGISEAIARGIAVVVCSRCLEGYVGPAYGTPGGGRSLREAGVIFSNLPSQKARIKLMVALGSGGGVAAARQAFADEVVL